MVNLSVANWKKGYPIKKIFFCIMWIVILLAILGALKEMLRGEITTEDIGMTIFCSIVNIITIVPLVRYIRKKNQCVPYLNTVLATKELKELLKNEEFDRIELFEGTSFYKKIKESQHWICVNGFYISKELAVACSLNTYSTMINKKSSTYWAVLYMTGKCIEVDTGLARVEKERADFEAYIESYTDIKMERFGIDKKQYVPSYDRVLKQEKYKNMSMVDIIRHSKEMKEVVEQFYEKKRNPKKCK